MKHIAFVSLGCDKNLVDSEIALGKLVSSGYNSFASLEEAQFLILNTCAFIDDARRETEEWIKKFVFLKKKDPHKVLVIMGCYVERFREKLPSLYPDVDYWIGVNDFPNIVEILENDECKDSPRLFINGSPFLYDHRTERLLTTPSHYAYIKIAEGCSNRCSFCVIPFIRGPLRSRPWETIVKEALNLVEMGVREIILVAQDLSSYGLDLYHRRNLPLLLKKLGENLPSSVWLRLLYLSPYGLDDQLLEAVVSTRQVVKYLDIPLQHIDSRILRSMNRPFSRAQIEEKFLRIREFIPGVFLRTTFMVGFPGEDEEAFAELLDFVTRFRFERMGAFTYSPEADTPAYALGKGVEKAVKRERYQTLMCLQEQIMGEFHRGLVGKTVEVILDEGPQGGRKRYFWGRTYGGAPQVDCRTKVWVTGEKRFVPGMIVRVKIRKSSAYELEGEIV
ncbi:MAG: 30S ribosomal protein S12 methylthiotransferase RimO [Candidatus Atribacteria bacterium]|nr:30S ribosomal protein S12 methylthiotransferase RimO [Candidatus Atribacteria bacterium]